MAEVTYSARLRLPHFLERSRANLIQCPVYYQGALSAPTSGTITLLDPSATAIVDGAAITVTASIAQYSVAALTSYAYADGWTAEWALLMGDGVTHTYRNDAAVVYAPLQPPATDEDLFVRSPSLDPSSNGPITSLTHFQEYLEEAWAQIIERLAEEGREPWRIINAHVLREAHALLTLAIIYEGLAGRLNVAHIELADRYRAQFHTALGRARLLYDRSDQGVGDPKQKRSARQGGFWLL